MNLPSCTTYRGFDITWSLMYGYRCQALGIVNAPILIIKLAIDAHLSRCDGDSGWEA